MNTMTDDQQIAHSRALEMIIDTPDEATTNGEQR